MNLTNVLDSDTWKKLYALAEYRGIEIDELVEEIIQGYLQDLEENGDILPVTKEVYQWIEKDVLGIESEG